MMDRPLSELVQPPTHKADIYTDAAHAKDIVKGILHTVFFHRTFKPVTPISRDIPDLNITLPAIDDVDLEQLINDRAVALSHQLLDPSSTSSVVRAQLAVQFYEKKLKKATGYAYNFFGLGGGQRDGNSGDLCWEIWIIDVTLANENDIRSGGSDSVLSIMERSVHRAAEKIAEFAGREREHIPPITTATSEGNPFPYEIVLGEKGKGISLPVHARGAGIW